MCFLRRGAACVVALIMVMALPLGCRSGEDPQPTQQYAIEEFLGTTNL